VSGKDSISSVRFLIALQTDLGSIALVWAGIDRPVVERILLPGEKFQLEVKHTPYGSSVTILPPLIKKIARSLEQMLRGDAASFDLGNFNLMQCSPFQQKVLITEFGIPQGYVSTYGRIASFLGIQGGARAVGNALRSNPFPLVIPCHRVIRSDGSIGGYRGGVAMKKKLLEIEGICFSKSGKVVMNRVFYS
jgi:methylated-DNA-[protein]-cysteine S-methyltransferase